MTTNQEQASTLSADQGQRGPDLEPDEFPKGTLPAGPWVITPDAKLPFDLRIHTKQGLALAKVYGQDAKPSADLARAIAAIPRMIAALTIQALHGSEIAADALAGLPEPGPLTQESLDEIIAAACEARGVSIVSAMHRAGRSCIIWEPEELDGASPEKVEARLIEMGWDVIEALK